MINILSRILFRKESHRKIAAYLKNEQVIIDRFAAAVMVGVSSQNPKPRFYVGKKYKFIGNFWGMPVILDEELDDDQIKFVLSPENVTYND